MFWRKLQFHKNTCLAKYILKSGKTCFLLSKVAKDPPQLMKRIPSPRNKGIKLFCNAHAGKQGGRTCPLRSSTERDVPSQADVPIASNHHQNMWKKTPWSSRRAGPALSGDYQNFAAGFRQTCVKSGTVNALLYFTLKAQLTTLSNNRMLHMGFTVLKAQKLRLRISCGNQESHPLLHRRMQSPTALLQVAN